MTLEQLLTRLAAVASEPRLRVLALLADETLHVSELARRIGMSRPLLYMHLTKLEEAGFVRGRHELGADGKALKFYDLEPLDLRLDADLIRAAVAASPPASTKEQ
jgi:DNA-binding transcriptional ArsR family regulator